MSLLNLHIVNLVIIAIVALVLIVKTIQHVTQSYQQRRLQMQQSPLQQKSQL